MHLPDFMIIGAAKSATTSVAAYLAQHPQVYFSRSKEPNYFALAGQRLPFGGPAQPDVLFDLLYTWSTTDFDAYQQIFAGAGDGQKAGEGSVRYLYFPDAAERIHPIGRDGDVIGELAPAEALIQSVIDGLADRGADGSRID